jgi:hypothetical protein
MQSLAPQSIARLLGLATALAGYSTAAATGWRSAGGPKYDRAEEWNDDEREW